MSQRGWGASKVADSPPPALASAFAAREKMGESRLDCGALFPLDAAPQRKRCSPCAWVAKMVQNRRVETQEPKAASRGAGGSFGTGWTSAEVGQTAGVAFRLWRRSSSTPTSARGPRQTT
jgi:hypothetical protein